MIKTFCDNCGDEILPANAVQRRDDDGNVCNELLATLPKNAARRSQVRVGIRLVPHGDVCKRCVLQAIDTIDDRPKAAQEVRIMLPSEGERVYHNGITFVVTEVQHSDPADDLGVYVYSIKAERAPPGRRR